MSICNRSHFITYLDTRYKMGQYVCSICFLVILAVGDVVICGEDGYTTRATINTTNASKYPFLEVIHFLNVLKNLKNLDFFSYYYSPIANWQWAKAKSNSLPSTERLQKCWWGVLWCWQKIMPLQTRLSRDRCQSMFQRYLEYYWYLTYFLIYLFTYECT